MIISTPAKIILSGEHSVVYGAPAIGAPLSLFLYSRWTERAHESSIALNFKDEDVELVPSWDTLSEKLKTYRAHYALFRDGKLDIQSVLPAQHDLVTLVLASFHEKFGGALSGLSLRIDTEIPMSSGLGSSSSLILNLLQGLLRLSGKSMSPMELHGFARGIEDFQHGFSSGIDLALVSARQPVMFVKGQGIVKSMPPIPSGIVLVNTGKPSVSTGQCVAQVREKFAGSGIWEDFTSCTRKIEAAFAGDDNKALREGIAENQHLLNTIGVVPARVQSFVTRCLANGIAAKVCGAGAVAGDGAGMLWALADNDDTMRPLQDIAQEYGYTHGLYSVAS
jgi:mevalonate kinase